jgi:DNA-binding CsgD family transcriptional regulator
MKSVFNNVLVDFRLRAGILIATYRKNKSTITLAQVMTIVQRRLAFQKGAAYPVLIICPGIISFDEKALRYLESAEGMEGIKAAAILLDNWPLMKVAEPLTKKDDAIPTEYFSRLDAAVDWLHQECGIAGGAGLRKGRLEELEELLAMNKRSKAPVHLAIPRPMMTKAVLTDKEWQVGRLIAKGKTSQETAALLCISLDAVKKRRQHINKKLKIKNAVELVRWMIANEKNIM